MLRGGQKCPTNEVKHVLYMQRWVWNRGQLLMMSARAVPHLNALHRMIYNHQRCPHKSAHLSRTLSMTLDSPQNGKRA